MGTRTIELEAVRRSPSVFGGLFLYYEMAVNRGGGHLASENRFTFLGSELLKAAIEDRDRLRVSHYPIGETAMLTLQLTALNVRLVFEKVVSMMELHFEPSSFALRNAVFPTSPLKYLLAAAMVATLLVATRTHRALLLCYVTTLGFMSLLEQTWAPHHYILAMFFTLVVIASLLSTDNRVMVAVGMALAAISWLTVVGNLGRLGPAEARVVVEDEQALAYVRQNGLEDRVVQF